MPNIIDGETEAQIREVNCPRSHSWSKKAPGLGLFEELQLK
jgi:hypothetical protein